MKRIHYIAPIVLQAVIYITTLVLFKVFCRLKIEGTESVVRHPGGPYIFVANHTSEWDGILVRTALPFFSRKFSPMYYVAMGKDEYRDSGWRNYIYGGFLFKLLGAYPRYKGKKDYSYSLQNHIAILRKGRNVCIFPEGKRTHDGALGEIHGGVAYLVQTTGAFVVPVALSGLIRLTPLDFFLRRRTVRVSFGSVIEPEHTPLLTSNDYKERASFYMQRVKNLLPYPVHTDIDPSLGYEHIGFANRLLIPVLNSVPARFRKFIKRSHDSAHEVIEHKTTHRALEVLYHKGHPQRSKKALKRLFHFIWFNSLNSKAVRNRLRLVKREIRRLLEERALVSEEIDFLSIASGSARAVVEVMQSLPSDVSSRTSLTFVDKNPHAIEYSKSLTRPLKPRDSRWIIDTVGNFFKMHNNERCFDIIEMVGLLDYFDNEKTVRAFSFIYAHLKHGGALVTANIVPNREQRFVTNAIGWEMIYRTPDELASLLAQAGFSRDKLTIYYEPLKVHTVIIARR